MTRLGPVAVVIAASSSVASAGTYLGLGIGTAANGGATRSDGAYVGSMDGYERSGRLVVGTRMSKLSLEAQGSRYDTSFDHSAYRATQFGVGLKLNFPLGNNFELFGKGGVQRSWLNRGPSEMHDASGNGWFAGAGFEYRLNLGLTAASLFLDYQRSSTEFRNEYMVQWNGTAAMWTVGATVSI